jgi:TonB family protein
LPNLPDGVLRAGDSRLSQKRCPQPGAPPYPQAAKDAKVETRIVARCIVETNGTMSSCKLLKSHPLFEKPMLDHLNKAKVPPMTTTDGKPARVQCHYVYRFKIE